MVFSGDPNNSHCKIPFPSHEVHRRWCVDLSKAIVPEKWHSFLCFCALVQRTCPRDALLDPRITSTLAAARLLDRQLPKGSPPPSSSRAASHSHLLSPQHFERAPSRGPLPQHKAQLIHAPYIPRATTPAYDRIKQLLLAVPAKRKQREDQSRRSPSLSALFLRRPLCPLPLRLPEVDRPRVPG